MGYGALGIDGGRGWDVGLVFQMCCDRMEDIGNQTV